MENGWDDNRLKQEIENRKKILKYMMKNNLRSYKDVGGIVAEYGKDSEGLMKKVNEDMK